MRLAVISDTHLYEVSPWFARAYKQYLASADAIIHCGDMAGRPVWSFLMQHPGFHGVCGNMDDWTLRPELPDRLDLEWEGVRVGACHGWGRRQRLSRRIAEAIGLDHDLIFFGHSHAQEDSRFGEIRLVNPGSFQEGSGKFAYVDIEAGRVAVSFMTAE